MRRDDPDAPFSDQLEWLSHRYDPGHFLGGTLRPELRLTLGPRAKRAAAALAYMGAAGYAATSLLVAAFAGMPITDPMSLGLAVGLWHVGRRISRSAREAGTVDRDAEKRAVLRGMAGVGLAIAASTLVVCAALAALAVAGSVWNGNMGLAAAVFALAALAVGWSRRDSAAGGEPR